jgi:hypothetical protein
MKKLFLLLLFIATAFSTFSQDLIVRRNGDKIPCKVTGVDSLNVYFSLIRNGNEIATSIEKNKVEDIRYNASLENKITRESKPTSTSRDNRQNKEVYKSESSRCTTIGILQGGGSLVGFDVEFLVSKKLGVQAGVGFLGFGAGLNYHFAPHIKSSFVSLQYWHQGVGTGYVQSLIGPSYVYRHPKGITAQLGIAALVETGPNYTLSKKPDAMLIYSIGWYIP